MKNSIITKPTLGQESWCMDLAPEYVRMICLKRYFLALGYAGGFVIDAACGSGYGSMLLSQNDKVTSVLGVDYNEESIKLATKQYAYKKLKFQQLDIKQALVERGLSCDWLVSIETVEHIGLSWLPLMAKQVKKGLFFSVPYMEKPGIHQWHIVSAIHEGRVRQYLNVQQLFWMDAKGVVYYQSVMPDKDNPITLFGVWRNNG